MLRAEATWLAEALADQPAEALSPLVNVGSSTAHFRTHVQPWIDGEIFAPLRARGVAVVHVDLKRADGVDLNADLLSEEGFQAVKARAPAAMLLSNVLEHVPDPRTFAARSWAALRPGGLMLVTVPRSYPYHPDPIDTRFRPTPEDVVRLFPDAELVRADVISAGSYRDAVRRRPWLLVQHLLRAPFFFVRPDRWRQSMSRVGWLFRPYLLSMVVLRKAPGA